ncbi:MAG: arsenite methyltransferase [Candidatus Hydrogenedens sp.]|jgi:SAM-dependent methyltransferase|nr:arsenite methyltransferase [Candidatus Hydrogenedens sp.]
MNQEKDALRDQVRAGYGMLARETGRCCAPKTSCCGGDNSEALAKTVGYSDADLALLPEGANMGLSCGNPTAIAALKNGEWVIDLGSGGGFDAFIAAQKVGPEGRVIGVDMTADMISLARANGEQYRQRTGWDNVEFRLGEIEYLPVADATADVIISNCVINLSPEKDQVWREMFRALKPGGRVAVTDMALLKALPPDVKKRAATLIGCMAGAVFVEDTEKMVQAAGFVDIELSVQSDYIEKMTGLKASLYGEIRDHMPSGENLSDYIVSLSVSAKKPE